MRDHEPHWIATACGFAVLALLLLGEAYAMGVGGPADGGAAGTAPSGGVMAARFHIAR